MSSWPLLLLTVLSRVTAVCPRALLKILAQLFARLAILLRSRAAETTRRNLEICYPEFDNRQLSFLVHTSLTHTALVIFESGMIFRWSQRRLDDLLVSVLNVELLEAGLASGRGVLLLVPHFGNWEYLALYLGRYSLVALYDPPRQTELETPIRQARERTGARLEPLTRTGLRTAYRTLVEGGLLGLLPDQVPERSAGVHVPFFRYPALTMTLAHRLIKSRAPVVLLASARRVADGFSISFQNVAPAVLGTDAGASLAAMNQEIEALIAEDPGQYQWEYKRFKSPPEGGERVY